MYFEPTEVDIAVDALNPGAVFSKTKAFDVNIRKINEIYIHV